MNIHHENEVIAVNLTQRLLVQFMHLCTESSGLEVFLKNHIGKRVIIVLVTGYVYGKYYVRRVGQKEFILCQSYPDPPGFTFSGWERGWEVMYGHQVNCQFTDVKMYGPWEDDSNE